MASIIAITDFNWFSFLRDRGLNAEVNFWTPTPWTLQQINQGDRVYFKLRRTVFNDGQDYIAGFGEFVRNEQKSVNQAWIEFGPRNGCNDIIEFINTLNGTQNNIIIHNIQNNIGSIVLNNCVFLDNDQFFNMNDLNIDWDYHIQAFRYLTQDENDRIQPIAMEQVIENLRLVNAPREPRNYTTNARVGQSEFKRAILNAYNYQCCISGETIPELLEAAHIQEYRNTYSNHVQNGLLLRVDLHRLYDSGLIYINHEYDIKVSSILNGTIYEDYHNRPINYHEETRYQPSVDALMSRLQNFRA